MTKKSMETIDLIGRIDEELLRRFLFEYEKKQQAAAISFFIDSGGGFVDSAIEIARHMNALDTPFITVAGKFVGSAAFFLHQCCPGERIAYCDSSFFLHRQYKKNPDVKISEKEKAQEFIIFNTIAIVTGKTVSEIQLFADKETIFSAQEAKELGFVTRIIDSPVPSGGVFFMLECSYDKTKNYHPPRDSRLPRHQQASRLGGSW